MNSAPPCAASSRRSTLSGIVSAADLPSGPGRSTTAPLSELCSTQVDAPGRILPTIVQSVAPDTRSRYALAYSRRSAAKVNAPPPETRVRPSAVAIAIFAGPPSISIAISRARTSRSVNATLPFTFVSAGTPAMRSWASANVNSPPTLLSSRRRSGNASFSARCPLPPPSLSSACSPIHPATGLRFTYCRKPAIGPSASPSMVSNGRSAATSAISARVFAMSTPNARPRVASTLILVPSKPKIGIDRLDRGPPVRVRERHALSLGRDDELAALAVDERKLRRCCPRSSIAASAAAPLVSDVRSQRRVASSITRGRYA